MTDANNVVETLANEMDRRAPIPPPWTAQAICKVGEQNARSRA
jgi:hypothetical protein